MAANTPCIDSEGSVLAEKTSTGKIVAAVGGLLLIISLFLKWAGVDIPDGLSGAASELGSGLSGPAADAFNQAQQDVADAASANAFDMFGWLPFLYIVIGVLAILPAVLDIFDLEIELPFDASLVTLVAGLLALGGMLVVLDSPGSIKIGAILAILASIAMTAGGLMQVSEGDDDGAVAAAPVGYAPPPAAAPPAAQPPAAAPPTQAPPAAAPPTAAPPATAPPAAPPQPPTPPPGA